MNIDRKTLLLQAAGELKTEVKLYRGLVHKAESMLKGIEAELTESFTPGNSNYSHGELIAVRREILSTLGNHWTAPREVVDRLHEHCSDLVMREVHKLADNPRSDVMWNKRRGPASLYRRFRAIV